MKEYYCLDEGNIYIYGYGNRGKKLINALESRFSIAGVIDENAHRIDVRDIHIFTVDDFFSEKHDQNSIIVVTIQSGMSHDSIAKMFYDNGYRRIVFSPIQIYGESGFRHDMRSIFGKLISMNFEAIGSIPVHPGFESIDNRVIRKSEEYVSFWCPISRIFCTSSDMQYERVRYNSNMCDVMQRYLGKTVEEYRPYLELFKYLKGEKADLSEYFVLCNLDAGSEDEWLQNRMELYSVFKYALKYDMDFFIEAPSICVWDENIGSSGYFNIVDGTTRAFFLIENGYTEIPIIVKNEDYKKGL